MGLLDFDDSYKPPFTPHRDDPVSNRRIEHERLAELNNLGHKEVSEDYSDSPHADRKEPEEPEQA